MSAVGGRFVAPVAKGARDRLTLPCGLSRGLPTSLIVGLLTVAALAFAGPALAGTGAPTGYLEICKETQGGLTGTYEFSFAGRTTHVTVANGSTQPVCTPGQQVPAGQVSVTEKQPPDTELCGIRTIQPGRLAWTRGATASVVIPAGGPETESTLVFCNRSAPKGSIAVCKETQGGLTGTFSFDLAGVRKSVHVSKSGADPVCAQRIDVAAGRVNVTETGVAGTTLCGVRTLPSGRVASTSGTTAGVTVVAGELTNVVFCDRPVQPGAGLRDLTQGVRSHPLEVDAGWRRCTRCGRGVRVPRSGRVANQGSGGRGPGARCVDDRGTEDPRGRRRIEWPASEAVWHLARVQEGGEEQRLVEGVAGTSSEGATGSPEDAGIRLVTDVVGHEPEDPVGVEVQVLGERIDRVRVGRGGHGWAGQRIRRAPGRGRTSGHQQRHGERERRGPKG